MGERTVTRKEFDALWRKLNREGRVAKIALADYWRVLRVWVKAGCPPVTEEQVVSEAGNTKLKHTQAEGE
jgi:hypothetical protein